MILRGWHTAKALRHQLLNKVAEIYYNRLYAKPV
jgi:hypothetical protein